MESAENAPGVELWPPVLRNAAVRCVCAFCVPPFSPLHGATSLGVLPLYALGQRSRNATGNKILAAYERAKAVLTIQRERRSFSKRKFVFGYKMILWATILLMALDIAFGGTNQMEFDQSAPMFPDSQFIDLISRDIESFSGPLGVGHKFMSDFLFNSIDPKVNGNNIFIILGGAGEGVQQLGPEGPFEQRQQVKSDNVLPAYCEPPNPCPIGYDEKDGCTEQFENTAEFSRSYQGQQQCLCDQEHMFNCPSKNNREEYEQDLEQLLANNGLHKSMIAKKFHLTRAEEPRRRKRSVAGFGQPQAHLSHSRYNPYLEGAPLKETPGSRGRKLPRAMSPTRKFTSRRAPFPDRFSSFI
uniref:Neuroendocrine protein 7B2 n=1 Tax=Globodera rostochiensis TaxID=31243 RepID=A0A914HI48_GLORO